MEYGEAIICDQDELAHHEELIQMIVDKRYEDLKLMVEARKKTTEAVAGQFLAQS